MADSSPPGNGGRPRVAVVFGGRSSEHAISCVSAGSVLRAIDRTAYDVVPDRHHHRRALGARGRRPGPAGHHRRPAAGGRRQRCPGGPRGRPNLRRPRWCPEPGDVPRVLGDVDVVFPLLHGPFGEDGTLQGLLELAGVPYVGSGVLASAVAMDKSAMKVLLAAAGLPVGPYVVVPDRDWPSAGDRGPDQGAACGLPVFVKPARAGSSVGISKVASWDDLAAAVEAARAHDPKVVVEQAVRRPRDRVRRARVGATDGPSRPASAARSPSSAGTSSTTSRPSTSRWTT